MITDSLLFCFDFTGGLEPLLEAIVWEFAFASFLVGAALADGPDPERRIAPSHTEQFYFKAGAGGRTRPA